MGQGGSKVFRVDAADKVDPRIGGRAAQKGTLFRFLPDVGDPTLLIKADDGFSTNWIPASAGGLLPITVVDSASVGNIDLTNLPADVDGVVPTTFLAKNQTAPAENGVYNYPGVGLAATRTAGWDVAADFEPGREVFVNGGTTNADTMWANADFVATLGTDPVTFVRVGGSAVVGDPNTLAYFDNAGNIADNLTATFDGSINAMTLGITSGGAVVQATGVGSRAFGRSSTSGSIVASGRGAIAQGNVVTGTINAGATGAIASGNVAGGAGAITANSLGAIAVGEVNDGTILSGGVGSIANGQADGAASQIAAQSIAAKAFGHATAGGTITASGGEASMAFGSATITAAIVSDHVGSIARGSATDAGSSISAQGDASEAAGDVDSAGVILADDIGAKALGYSSGAGSTISADNRGAIAQGSATGGGKIQATAIGAKASGNSSSTSNGNVASGIGSLAQGNSVGTSDIIASGTGSIASGNATSNGGQIVATSNGSVATGAINNDQSNIFSNSVGSYASGFCSQSGTIASQGLGSIAFGQANGPGSQVLADNSGSIAVGFADAGAVLHSGGIGSFAQGNAVAANITASGDGSFAGGSSVTVGAIIASGIASMARGSKVTVSGDYASALGVGHNNSSYASLNIGRYSLPTAFTPGAWVATEPVLVVGNGTGVGTEADAYRLDKDGRQTTTAAHIDKIRVIVGTDTLSARTDFKAICNAGAGAFNLNLPAGVEGLNFVIGAAAANVGVFTIVANGGDVLDTNIQTIFNASEPVPITFTGGTWYAI